MFGAIVCQMPEYVQLLIEKGCDINMHHQGVTPLQFATEDYIGQGPTVEIIDMLGMLLLVARLEIIIRIIKNASASF